MICQFLKSFVRGALAVCGPLVWLAVGWVERIGVTQRRSTKGFYQAIEGFGMRGIPTPGKAHPNLRKPGWMLFGLWLNGVRPVCEPNTSPSAHSKGLSTRGVRVCRISRGTILPASGVNADCVCAR